MELLRLSDIRRMQASQSDGGVRDLRSGPSSRWTSSHEPTSSHAAAANLIDITGAHSQVLATAGGAAAGGSASSSQEHQEQEAAWAAAAAGQPGQHGQHALRSALSHALRLVEVLRVENSGLRDQLAVAEHVLGERDEQLEELREVCELHRSHRDSLLHLLAQGTSSSALGGLQHATAGEASPSAASSWLSSLLPPTVGQWVGGSSSPLPPSPAPDTSRLARMAAALFPGAAHSTAQASARNAARMMLSSLPNLPSAALRDTDGSGNATAEGGLNSCVASDGLLDNERWSSVVSSRPSPHTQQPAVSSGSSSARDHCLLRARSTGGGFSSELGTPLLASPLSRPGVHRPGAYNWRRATAARQSEPRLSLGSRDHRPSPLAELGIAEEGGERGGTATVAAVDPEQGQGK